MKIGSDRRNSLLSINIHSLICRRKVPFSQREGCAWDSTSLLVSSLCLCAPGNCERCHSLRASQPAHSTTPNPYFHSDVPLCQFRNKVVLKCGPAGRAGGRTHTARLWSAQGCPTGNSTGMTFLKRGDLIWTSGQCVVWLVWKIQKTLHNSFFKVCYNAPSYLLLLLNSQHIHFNNILMFSFMERGQQWHIETPPKFDITIHQ